MALFIISCFSPFSVIKFLAGCYNLKDQLAVYHLTFFICLNSLLLRKGVDLNRSASCLPRQFLFLSVLFDFWGWGPVYGSVIYVPYHLFILPGVFSF